MTYASACAKSSVMRAPQQAVSLAQGAAMFTPFNVLVKAGAKWGDIEVFELEEWHELLAIRLAASLYVPPEDFTTFETLIEYGDIARAYVEPEPEEKAGERDFDAEVDALLDLPMPMMQGVACATQMPSLPRNDVDQEELFERPPPRQYGGAYRFFHNKDKDDECIFSGTKQRRMVQAIPSVTLSLPEIVAKNPERAIESRDFCGNC